MLTQESVRFVESLPTCLHIEPRTPYFVCRGFSVNRLTSDDNMGMDALIAQRLIYDTTTKLGGVTEIPITQELRRSCKSSLFRMVLEKSKQDQCQIDVRSKTLTRLATLVEINSLKKSQVEVTKAFRRIEDFGLQVLRLHLVLVAINHEKIADLCCCLCKGNAGEGPFVGIT